MPDSDQQVVVVANFSDYNTPDPFRPGAEYVVPNWPPTAAGRRWREITQDRDVPPGGSRSSPGKRWCTPWFERMGWIGYRRDETPGNRPTGEPIDENLLPLGQP